jgi:hypothetical protein
MPPLLGVVIDFWDGFQCIADQKDSQIIDPIIIDYPVVPHYFILYTSEPFIVKW